MTDTAIVLTVILGFALIVVGASRLGAGTTLSFQGLWGPSGVRDWPHGVQEGDAPRFAVTHLDDLRPGTQAAIEPIAADEDGDEPRPEMVELEPRPTALDEDARASVRVARPERL